LAEPVLDIAAGDAAASKSGHIGATPRASVKKLKANGGRAEVFKLCPLLLG
jgi:uncharacterized protein YfaA (DUF2138 family)